jgi:hypothetical protein
MKLENDAINVVLRVIGEPPLDVGTAYTDLFEAEAAYDTLEIVKQEILSDGWTFNSETDREYIPDVDGYIVVPENVLRIDPSDTGSDFVRKDGKLYDRETKSYIFTAAVGCDVIFNFDFDDIPNAFQNYISLRAARLVYQRLVGDVNTIGYLKQDEQEAYLKCLHHEDDTGDYNIFDENTVARVISRTTNPTGIRG